ncbi:MAG TPA: hypothetical protein VHB54_10020 [Mucilaginibacter sp.]|nr:hypothetical protein [Mucilaginibacter sp.]
MKYIYEGVVVPTSVILPISIGLIIGYKRNYLKVIFFYLVFAGIIDVVEEIIGAYHVNNLPLLHFYTIIEFLFMMGFFQTIITEILIRKLIRMLIFLFPLLAILNFIFFQSIYKYNSYPRPIAALIIIGLCITYFFKRNEPDDQTSWTNDPLNWMVSGLLVYFGSSLFHFAFLNIVYEHASLNLYFILGAIHATLVMIMYLLFAVGFLYAKNQR